MPLIALVRPPTASIEAGLRTHIGRSSIDFARAQEQHINYVSALRDAGAQIVALSEAEHLPDAVFIEDTALVLDSLAVMAHSAAQSRRAEAPTVAGALSNQDDAAITSAMIAMAHHLRLRVVAEGVETQPQMDLLEQMECEEVQGFLFSRPVPPAAFRALLGQDRG